MGSQALFTAPLQERQPLASRLLLAAAERGALANAYLFTGPSRSDKWELALQLAAALNCTRESSTLSTGRSSCVSQACPPEQCCVNCRWIANGEHPQAWHLLKREPDKTKIAVEKARLLCEEILKSSAYFRVIVVTEAEQSVFHDASANALLKSIEEPGARCLFVFFAGHADMVLPTIVSRCQVLEVSGAYPTGFLWNDDDASEEARQALETHRRQFIREFPSVVESAITLKAGSIKYVLESRSIAERLAKLTEEYGLSPAMVIDAYVSADFECLKVPACDHGGARRYLNRLLSVAETAKQELDHYVKLNNVVETFAYSVAELRSHFSGELRLAISS